MTGCRAYTRGSKGGFVGLSDQLVALDAQGVLVLASERGYIQELACAMETCLCPDGRAYFEKKGRRLPWQPSADHFPVLAREGGPLAPENVRLAHWKCNYTAGGQAGGRAGGLAGGRKGALVANGNRTPEQRKELARLASRAAYEQSTPEQRKERARIGSQAAHAARTKEQRQAWGHKGGSNYAKNHTPEQRQAAAQKAGLVGGYVGMCSRWNITRGKPCTCGRHK